MPTITITIDEQQEAKVTELIDGRKAFRVLGGQVVDSDGKTVFLDYIEFRFFPDKRICELAKCSLKPGRQDF